MGKSNLLLVYISAFWFQHSTFPYRQGDYRNQPNREVEEENVKEKIVRIWLKSGFLIGKMICEFFVVRCWYTYILSLVFNAIWLANHFDHSNSTLKGEDGKTTSIKRKL